MFHPKANRILPCIFAACFLFCNGCSFSTQDQESDGSGYLFTVDLAANPKSLDPQSATDAASKTIITNLYEGLVELDTDGNIQMAGAQSYTISEDGLTYTFQLEPEHYWYYDANSDDVVDEGETWAVTAADYAYAFQRIFNPDTQSPYIEMFSCLKNATAIQNGEMDYTAIGVTALSDTQLQFTLDYANTQFLYLLTSTAAMPCNESFFEQTKGRYGLDEESVASCGAFYLRLWFYDAYGSDNLIYMRRNSANTSIRSVFPANLTFQIRNSLQETADDFADENSDILVTPIYMAQYANDEDYTMTSYCATTLGLIFNTDSEIFSNQNIRKGLSMGIDRNNIGENSDGDLTAASTIIPPAVHLGSTYYRDRITESAETYDTEAAVATFQQGMQELGIESLDTTKILVCSTLMDCENLHDIIQTWQEIFGFYIGIDEVTESEYWERIADKDYTIAVYGITATEDSPSSVLEQFASDENAFYYANTSVDEKIDALQTCTTETQLLEQCAALEEIIVDDAWFIPIFYKNQYCITTSDNADVLYNPFSGALNFRNAKHYS